MSLIAYTSMDIVLCSSTLEFMIYTLIKLDFLTLAILIKRVFLYFLLDSCSVSDHASDPVYSDRH